MRPSRIRHVDSTSSEQDVQDRFAIVPGLVVSTLPIPNSSVFTHLSMWPPLGHPWPSSSSVCASRGSGSKRFSLGMCSGTSLKRSRRASVDERVRPRFGHCRPRKT